MNHKVTLGKDYVEQYKNRDDKINSTLDLGTDIINIINTYNANINYYMNSDLTLIINHNEKIRLACDQLEHICGDTYTGTDEYKKIIKSLIFWNDYEIVWRLKYRKPTEYIGNFILIMGLYPYYHYKNMIVKIAEEKEKEVKIDIDEDEDNRDKIDIEFDNFEAVVKCCCFIIVIVILILGAIQIIN